jgi:transcription elongation GreA/GreB family factor
MTTTAPPNAPRTNGAAFMLLRDLDTGECQAHELVAHAEESPSHARFSLESPTGKALAAAKLGARLTLDTVHGTRRYQVLSMDRHVDW